MYKLQVLIADTPGQYLISVAIIRLLESCWLVYVAGLGPTTDSLTLYGENVTTVY